MMLPQRIGHARSDDPTFKSASVFLAGYYTEPDSTTFGMHDAAGSVRLQLLSSVEGHPPVITKKNLLFVAHSLGGILTRDMLTRYTSDFVGKRVGLLLVASPSNGSAYADRLIPPNWVAKSNMVEELQVASPYLSNLDNEFRRLLKDPHLALEGREIYEHRFIDLNRIAR